MSCGMSSKISEASFPRDFWLKLLSSVDSLGSDKSWIHNTAFPSVRYLLYQAFIKPVLLPSWKEKNFLLFKTKAVPSRLHILSLPRKVSLIWDNCLLHIHLEPVFWTGPCHCLSLGFRVSQIIRNKKSHTFSGHSNKTKVHICLITFCTED